MVRVSFLELDNIILTFTVLASSQTQRILLEKTMNFESTTIDLLVTPRQVCSIGSLTVNIVHWLNWQTSIETPRLSAAEFFAVIRPVVPDGIASRFQRLIYGESYSSRSSNCLTEADFHHMGAIAGQDCLSFLDKKLTRQSLASCSKDELQILFFVVVNTISAISDTRPVSHFETLPSSSNIVCYSCPILLNICAN